MTDLNKLKVCKPKKSGDKKYYCYFELTLQLIGGKWKGMILYRLGKNGTMRFGKLKKSIPDITEKMLVQKLRELETDKLISREIYREVPPRVEYSLTKYGQTIVPLLIQLREWGVGYEKEVGLSEKFKGQDLYEQPEDETE